MPRVLNVGSGDKLAYNAANLNHTFAYVFVYLNGETFVFENVAFVDGEAQLSSPEITLAAENDNAVICCAGGTPEYLFSDLAVLVSGVDALPAAPTIATVLNGNDVTVSWGATLAAESYRVRYEQVGVGTSFTAFTIDLTLDLIDLPDGTYNIAVEAMNSQGSVLSSVSVVSFDVTAPVITLTGAATIEIDVDDPYSDPGFIATDNIDGDIAGSVVVSGDTVDPATAGVYVVNYDVSDAAGNAATTVQRTITVNAPIVQREFVFGNDAGYYVLDTPITIDGDWVIEFDMYRALTDPVRIFRATGDAFRLEAHHGAGMINFQFNDLAGTNADVFTPATFIAENEFATVRLEKNSATGEIVFYLNGHVMDTETMGPTLNPTIEIFELLRQQGFGSMGAGSIISNVRITEDDDTLHTIPLEFDTASENGAWSGMTNGASGDASVYQLDAANDQWTWVSGNNTHPATLAINTYDGT